MLYAPTSPASRLRMASSTSSTLRRNAARWTVSMADATARQMTDGCVAARWAAEARSETCRSLRRAREARRARSGGAGQRSAAQPVDVVGLWRWNVEFMAASQARSWGFASGGHYGLDPLTSIKAPFFTNTCATSVGGSVPEPSGCATASTASYGKDRQYCAIVYEHIPDGKNDNAQMKQVLALLQHIGFIFDQLLGEEDCKNSVLVDLSDIINTSQQVLMAQEQEGT
ncbi:hypothetical protein VTK26DRAFT_3601 [Humicola hyalothermophila]